MVERHFRCPKVQELTGLSRSSIYGKMDPKSSQYDPNFPKPIRVGKRSVAWPESALAQWLDELQAA